MRSLGFVVSVFDSCVLYLRRGPGGTHGGPRVGPLLAMLVIHVDDIGASGEEAVLDWCEANLSEKYGAVKSQRDDFLHVGHHYRGLPGGGISTDIEHFVQGVEEPYVPTNILLPCDPEQITEMRRVNGSMQYAASGRPDMAPSSS